jgi:hypothetical protein
VSDFDFLSDLPMPFGDDELETARQLDRPKIRRHRVNRRELRNGLKKEALNELIPTLPPPDTDLYIIGNGAGAEVRHGINPLAFDFGTFIPHLTSMLGDRQCTAYISTWTMNDNHVQTMIEMLADGRLKALAVMVDPYFSRRTPAIYARLITGLQEHGGRFKAFKNHCKIIAIADADERRTCVIMGSANLSAQPRCENYTLTTAPDVYQWVRDEFFEAMLTNAETNQSQ